MNFVSGGILIGDKVEELIPKDTATSSQETQPKKKRKRTVVTEAPLPNESSFEAGCLDLRTLDRAENAGKQLKRKHDRQFHGKLNLESSEDNPNEEMGIRSDLEAQSLTGHPPPVSASRAEKRRRKEERKERREPKRANIERRGPKENAEAVNQVTSSVPADPITEPLAAKHSDSFIPINPVLRGRNALRQKYIQQKKMSSLDPKALNEVSIWFPSTFSQLTELTLP